MGVQRRPGTASSTAADRPVHRAPSGNPTPIMPSVEEYRNQHQPTPLLDFLRHVIYTRLGARSMGAMGKTVFQEKKWSSKSQHYQILTTHRVDDA